MWAAFARLADRLDGLICNAGALFNERTETPQGVEATFALHLLYGSYLMTKLAITHLSRSDDPRVVLVSSGGMLNVPWPTWEIGTAQAPGEYDGQLAYAYAKRAQVLLAERWTIEHPGIKFISAHPGWTATAAVEAAYGESKSYLEPMRSTWEGAEGLAWLAAVPGEQIESGEFYLDRSPHCKHLAGLFFSEGSYTKNSEAQVDLLLANLDSWASGRWGELPLVTAKAAGQAGGEESLQPMAEHLELDRFMGRWYVATSIPTYFERGASNCIETYTWDAEQQHIDVNFTYTGVGGDEAAIVQRANVMNAPANTEWSISPRAFGLYSPLGLGYIIVHCDTSDYSFAIVGVPNRSYVWFLARSLPVPLTVYVDALRRAEAAGFDLSQLVKVEHAPSLVSSA